MSYIFAYYINVVIFLIKNLYLLSFFYGEHQLDFKKNKELIEHVIVFTISKRYAYFYFNKHNLESHSLNF